MDDKVKYWLELSDYDLDTAKAMLDSKRYLYVGFMCHQTIEKIFKAYFAYNHPETPPYTHSLSYLANKGGFYEEFTEDQKNFIDQIEPLNIEARYPSHKERILKSLTDIVCQKLIQNTEDLQQWIKAKL
ncbi:MAG: HEPN domain-containing protein [Bacteroidales bacterium]